MSSDETLRAWIETVEPGTLRELHDKRATCREQFEIIEQWMPRFPRGHTPCAFVVRMRDGTTDWYLRHSKGPLQGHFLDIYPDDYKRRELAELAIEIHLHPPSLAVASASTPIEEPFAAVVRRRIVETMDELERTKATCRQLAESLRGLKDGLKIRKDLEADRRAESVIDTIIADARAATEIKEQDR